MTCLYHTDLFFISSLLHCRWKTNDHSPLIFRNHLTFSKKKKKRKRKKVSFTKCNSWFDIFHLIFQLRNLSVSEDHNIGLKALKNESMRTLQPLLPALNKTHHLLDMIYITSFASRCFVRCNGTQKSDQLKCQLYNQANANVACSKCTHNNR